MSHPGVLYEIMTKNVIREVKPLLQIISVLLMVLYISLLFFCGAEQQIGFYRNGSEEETINKRRIQSLEESDVDHIINERSNSKTKRQPFSHEDHEIGTVTDPWIDNEVIPVATPKSVMISLDDVFISVKTTKKYHSSRLAVIIDTWFRLAKKQTWFFTDFIDENYQQATAGHLINTNCSSSHNRKALCCKMSVEFDTFLDSNKKWFCHFDDDNYVNVPRLIKVLSEYDPQSHWYLGKPSIRTPLEILNREGKDFDKMKDRNISFWFATGGAGFCLSKALVLKMAPIASGGRFMGIGDRIRLPDDVTMGYVVEHLLKKPLTVIQEFHSHLEPMKLLQPETFHQQITFSYSQYNKEEMNVVKIDNGFDLETDPTRFYSLHCFLFPNFSFCPRK